MTEHDASYAYDDDGDLNFRRRSKHYSQRAQVGPWHAGSGLLAIHLQPGPQAADARLLTRHDAQDLNTTRLKTDNRRSNLRLSAWSHNLDYADGMLLDQQGVHGSRVAGAGV